MKTIKNVKKLAQFSSKTSESDYSLLESGESELSALDISVEIPIYISIYIYTKNPNFKHRKNYVYFIVYNETYSKSNVDWL